MIPRCAKTSCFDVEQIARLFLSIPFSSLGIRKPQLSPGIASVPAPVIVSRRAKNCSHPSPQIVPIYAFVNRILIGVLIFFICNFTKAKCS